MKIADGIVRFTQSKNLRHVFGVSGANIEELFFSFSQSPIKPILAKTEYQAVLMAIGSYLTSQKVHLALTTSGAGVLNTLPVLAEAYSHRQPLILIAGLPPTHLEGQGAFQDTSSLNGSLDLEAVLKPLVCFQQKVNAGEQLFLALNKAWQSAEQEKRPAVIFINKNIFAQLAPSFEVNPLQKIAPLLPSTTELKSKLTNLTIRPLFIFGEELFHLQNRSILKKLCEKYNAVVTCTPQAKGFIDHQDTRFTGLIGMMGSTKTKDVLSDVSHVVIIGSRMDHLSRFGFEEQLKKKTIFHISTFSDPSFISTDLSINGDLDFILESLL